MSTEEKKELTTQDVNQTPTKRIRIGGQSALHQRVTKVETEKKTTEFLVSMLPNRIGVMLDDSGSMQGVKASNARVAARAFIDALDPNTTAIAVDTFDRTFQFNLTNDFLYARHQVEQLTGVGGTDLYTSMKHTLENESITHAIIVSDGDANTPHECIEYAHNYKEMGVKVDCVHIGDSTGGEQTLKEIASITGGMYIKFTDTINFAKNFKYLAPGYRAMLPANAGERARLLGAKEVL